MQCLTEKQQLFAALYETITEQETPHKGLLLRGDATDLQQGTTLLKGAINEGRSSVLFKLTSVLWSLVHPGCNNEAVVSTVFTFGIG